jgi:hypothetical protein
MKYKLSLVCDYKEDEKNPTFGVNLFYGRSKIFIECLDRTCAVELIQSLKENSLKFHTSESSGQ